MRRTLTMIAIMTLLAGCTGGGADGTKPTGTTEARPSAPLLLVGSCWEGGQILRFDGSNGKFMSKFADKGELDCAEGDGIIGPDGNLYVTNFSPGRIDQVKGSKDSVVRYNPKTGEFIDVFISPSPQLDGPHGLAFGPDGNLYVATRFTDSVLRYDGRTGKFIDEFIPPGSGGLNDADRIVFRPDGRLYVVSLETASVLRYDSKTGKFIDEFVKAGSGGLTRPHDLVFGPDGELYVSSFPNNAIMRYDGKTGEFLGEFVKPGTSPLEYVGKMAFGPNGNLFATSCINNMVLEYEKESGKLVGPRVAAGSGGLNGTTFMVFV